MARKMKIIGFGPLVALAVVVLLGACGGSRDVAGKNDSEVPSDFVISDEMVILDVRDADEFASGHLPNAVHLSFNDGTLEAELPKLNKAVNYVLYCRSGNRSSQAKKMMEEAGFENVLDLGGVEEALSVTGLSLVTE